MTDISQAAVENSAGTSATWRERWAKTWTRAQFFIAVALTGGFAAYLFLFPHGLGRQGDETPHPKPVEVVQAVGPLAIAIQKGSGIEQKLELSTVQQARIATPLLVVTGTVAASLRPSEAGGNSWQFNAPDVLTAYNDWQKAVAEVAFAETQLKQVQALAETRLSAQQKVVDQFEQAVKAGTETLKNMAAEKTVLAQYEIQGKKEVHEADTALRTARRQESALAHQLQQSGLEPTLLATATPDLDIIVADVPEAFLARVKIGQQCQARFLSLPDRQFTGRVNSILPVLAKDRRTLRLLFVIDDPEDELRPGMFGEIGLGTDPRDALLIAADGVLHIGRADYVLSRSGDDGPWHVTEVQVGEPQRGQVEVLRGLAAGERLIGKGAILLKPVVVRSLQAEQDGAAAPRLSRAETP